MNEGLPLRNDRMPEFHQRDFTMPSDYLPPSLRDNIAKWSAVHAWVYAGMLAAGMLFSSIHIAGWNLSFLSATDMWTWRISAIITTVVPVLGLLDLCIEWASEPDPGKFWCLFVNIPFHGLLYFAARLALIVEMFRGLAYSPPGAFAATWTANLPHV